MHRGLQLLQRGFAPSPLLLLLLLLCAAIQTPLPTLLSIYPLPLSDALRLRCHQQNNTQLCKHTKHTAQTPLAPAQKPHNHPDLSFDHRVRCCNRPTLPYTGIHRVLASLLFEDVSRATCCSSDVNTLVQTLKGMASLHAPATTALNVAAVALPLLLQKPSPPALLETQQCNQTLTC